MKTFWINSVLNKIPFTGNLGLTLTVTIFIFIMAFFLKAPINYIIQKVLKKIGNQYPFFKLKIISQISKPLSLISLAIIWLVILNFMPPLWKYMGGIPLFLSQPIITVVQILIKIIIGSGVVWFCHNIVDTLIAIVINYFDKKLEQPNNLKNHFIPFISRIIKIIILCFGSLLVLQSLGINVVSLMAGVGIGGVALALAAKDSVSNILAYVNIMLDKPFFVGDWIRFNNTEGTVVSVGIRSAKLKTFYDSIITVPNSVLTSVNIDNMGKRKSRRTRLYLGVQYNTSPQNLENFISGIKQILLNNPQVKKDYYQVYFSDFGASELKIIMNFFLYVNTWENELQHKQDIFFNILKLAKKLEINFAFPTQTIHLETQKNEKKQ